MTGKLFQKPAELVLAVSKGRIFKQVLPLLESAGISILEDPEESRKLVLATSMESLKLLIIRPSDVPTFVEYGAADLGITGKDVLLEYDSDDYYELLDLGIAKCSLMVAGMPGTAISKNRLKIATKYSRVATAYFASLGIQAELIKLYGSMELAPSVGLADFIVDLVDTGDTLKANGLVPLNTICEISSRLIVNKATMKTKNSKVKNLIQMLRDAKLASDKYG